MRKRMGLFAGLMVLAGWAWAGKPLVSEAPIAYSGIAVTVSVSTSAWTKANDTTSAILPRTAIRITNPSSNTASVYAICHEDTPTEAITVKINEIGKGTSATMPCGAGLNLYLLSGHTSAENVHIWEVGQ